MYGVRPKRRPFGFFRILFRITILFLLIAGGALYFLQEKLLFHPEVLSPGYHFALSRDFEERVVESGGERVHGLLVRAQSPRGLLVYLHGNAGSLNNWSEVADEIATRLHWNVWIIDYPGFGKSSGTIRSEAQLYAAADDVFAAARREAAGGLLAVMGRSIGTGLAVRLAARNDVAALVLETPYTSMRDVAHVHYPWAPLFLLRYPLDAASWMPMVKAPTLIFHGDADEIIPYEEGRTLAAMKPKARLVTFPGGHHNGLRHFPLYWKELGAFLAGLRH